MLRCVLIAATLGACLADMPSTTFTKDDGQRLLSLASQQAIDDAKSAYKLARVANFLGAELSNKAAACKAASKFDENDPEQIFSVVQANALLGCNNAPSPSSSLITKLTEVLDDTDDLHEMLPALRAYVALGKAGKLTVESDALSSVVSRVEELKSGKGRFRHTKADQASFLASGRVWQSLAIAFNHGELGDDDLNTLITISEEIPQMLKALQKEQGDSNVLQISDGDNKEAGALQSTSEVLVGVIQLARALDDKFEITPAQMDKFASYFLGQKDSLHSLDDMYHFVLALNALTDNSISVPLAATLKQNVLQQSGSGSSGSLVLSVTDLLGQPATTCKVIALRAVARGASAPLLSNQEAFPVAKDSDTNTDYQLNLFAAKPEPGVYEIDFSITPLGDKKFSASTATRSVKVATTATVSDVSLALLDLDGHELSKHNIATNKPLASKIRASATNDLAISLNVRSATTNKPIKPHQVFARFYSPSGNDVIFVIPFTDKHHSLRLSVAEISPQFNFESGTYSVDLIVADANLLSPIVWHAATVDLEFPANKAPAKARTAYSTLPEIHHKFREPEKRPPQFVSQVFTALVLAPFALLLIAILRIGFNLSNMPSSFTGFISAILFVSCIGAIVALIAAYWFMLTIFETLYALMVLGPVTALVGNRALTAIQESSQQQTNKSKRD